jgi:hypothetical protein
MREGEKMKNIIRYFGFLALVLLLSLAVAGCAASKAATTSSAANSIIAAKTTAAITVDGKATEAAWATAPAATIKLTAEPGVEPRTITVRALYDAKSVYLLATYKDSTPFKIGEPWTFDGTNWSKGSFDDSLSFVWNMNDSIKDFNTKGFGVMTTPLKKGLDIFDFRIADANGLYHSYQADYWGWCGMPEFYGRGDDMIFRYNNNPASPAVVVQHDAYLNDKPWIRNEQTVGGKTVPIYMYKPGKTLANTPRPYQEDVEPITDNTAFHAGDQEPYVVGIKGAVWGGSKDDILTKGKTTGGVWTVEFARALNTGHADDIRLVAGQNATFAVIVRDDHKGYALSMPVTMRFE